MSTILSQPQYLNFLVIINPKYLISYFKAMEYVPVYKVSYLHCDNNRYHNNHVLKL